MTLVIDIAINARDFERMYTGAVRDVLAVARDGRTVRFPARHLRRFVTAAGVYGSFQFEIEGGRLAGIRRLAG